MKLIGKKPLALELIFGAVKTWDSSVITKQFTSCYLADTEMIFSDLSSYRKRDVELHLAPNNVKQLIVAKRFFVTTVPKPPRSFCGCSPMNSKLRSRSWMRERSCLRKSHIFHKRQLAHAPDL